VNTVGKLTIANAGIDFFVGLIRYTISVVVVLCFPELLSKFGETSFIRSSNLPDPLVVVEGLSKKRWPKQHRDDQSIAHVLFFEDRLARLRAHEAALLGLLPWSDENRLDSYGASTAASGCRTIGAPVVDCDARMSFSEGELNAQSICDFFNSPLRTDQIAGRRNYCRLPTGSTIFANLDFYLSDAQSRDDHVG
jgi:hypothetical protein